MESIDVTIIGAGVIGLSIASQIGRTGRSVYILEKNSSWGQETSSRNSEVIHAGIYYKPGSLKAISCVEGRDALYRLCEENQIGVKKTGKLIVALNEGEFEYLNNLKENAALNGVDLTLLDKNQTKELEPNVVSVGALFSPDTGIIDSHALMKYYLEKAKSKEVELVTQAEVVAVEKQGSQYRVEINNQGETINILSSVVINCAGNHADKIARLCGLDIQGCGYAQYYLKGNYFRLVDKFRNIMHHLVYPVPTNNSLGIHTVLDLSGGIRLGPDAQEVEEFDYKVDEGRKQEFFESVSQFLPGITEADLYSDMSGIRPQLRKPNDGEFRDFVIRHEEDKGLPGVINLIGIESPGLTASPYIAKHVSCVVEKLLN